MNQRTLARAPVAPAPPAGLEEERRPTRSFLEQAFPSFFAVKPQETIAFSKQVATLIETGIPLLQGLDLVQRQSGASRTFRAVLGQMRQDLAAGLSFSEALSRHPTVFSEIYRRTLAIGERTGRIEVVLRQMAEFMEKQLAMKKKLGGALTYPALILVVAAISSGVLLTTALPPLVDMFKSLNVALPLPTRILIGLSSVITTLKLYLLGGMVALVVGGLWAFRQPRGRMMLDRFKLFAPVIGPPALMGELARFSRTLSILTAAGVSLQEVFEVLPRTSSNLVFRASLFRVRDGLMLGQGLAAPMSRTEVFPPLMVQMTAVAEESNAISSTMDGVAKFYETAAEERITGLVGILTPAITVFVALVAGFISMAIVLPMYQITSAFE